MARGPLVTRAELEQVGALVRRGLSDGAIAERLGRTRVGVRRWRVELLGMTRPRFAPPKLGRCRWRGRPTTTAEVWRRAAVIRATWSPEELEQRRNGRGLEALAERFGKGPEFERLAREVLGRQT